METLQKLSRHMNRQGWIIAAILAVIFLFIGFMSWYGYTRVVLLSSGISELSAEVDSLKEELASTTALLQENISQTHATLSQALEQEKQNVVNIKEQLGGFEQEVGSISGTVTTLEKLAKADPELLQKYSKIYFLNEHYAPERLSEIDKQYLYSEDTPELIHSLVWPRLKTMLDAAKNAGVELYVRSAYRSFDEQKNLKSEYTVTYGEGTANQFSADQGYSEHQLGTTVDFITTGLSGQLDGFEKTKAYQWMIDNAYQYGFVLSYPDKNGYYIFEPWHWRYVGVALAVFLRNENKYFYDLDQRKIDEYLVDMFE